MSALVESPPASSSQATTPRHSMGSNATFGVHSAAHEPEDQGKAALMKPSVTWNDVSTNGANAQSTESAAASTAKTPVQTVPEVNLNGGALPTPTASSSRATPRPRKTSTAVIAEAESSAWGANFWVTLIEPQSQEPFYACPATGQVSWDPPAGNFVLPPSAEGEWWELVDESRGLPYYYHTKTNETVWERPDAFIIPLAILQNTALCRRLSARYSQIFDADLSIVGATGNASKAIEEERPSNRRANSSGSSTSQRQQLRSQRSFEVDRPRRRSQSSTRSEAGDQRDSRQGHGRMHGYAYGTQLPPIPASPYATESSSPPSPDSKRASRAALANPSLKRSSSNGKEKEKEEKSKDSNSDKGKEKEKDKENVQVNGGEVTPPRNRTKSSPFVPYRSPQPQSLDAAAELLAHYPNGQGTQSPSNAPPVRKQAASPTTTASTPSSPTDAHLDFMPQASSSPVQNKGQQSGVQERQSFSLSISVEKGPISLPGLASPGGKFASLGFSKGKEKEHGLSPLHGFGVPQMPRRSMSSPPEHVAAALPMAGRRNTNGVQPGTIKTRDIGAPILDTQATLNLSPVKARQEGKPIFIEPKRTYSDNTRYSTGGRPVLPDDLASDIQQFVQAEFARQYFTTHRSGFIFRRKIPVEKMMVWQKPPLQSPLLSLNRSLHKDGVKVFKVIQRIMGDRERDRPVGVRSASDNHLNPLASSTSSLNASSTSLPSMVAGILEEERWLLTEGLAHGELRDEIYCQLVKQLTGNANAESVFRGWQLLCVLLVTFPPSKNFEAYLRSFIQRGTHQSEGRVDIMAKYCLQRLSIISRKGPRGKPPTLGEIETAHDAAFNPSTFGESLDAVLRLQERNYPHLQVPIILPFLADGILALGGTKAEGIFRIPGDSDTVSELKIRIERGYYNLEGVDDPHVPASLLKLWMRELCDPLVPNELYNDCVACARDPEACVQMVSRLPTINRRVVLFVVSFLQLFLDEKIQSVTKMTAANLALVMAPNLLRCDSESMSVVFTNAPYEQMFVHNLLLHLKCSKVDPNYVPKHGLGSAVASPSVHRNGKQQKRHPLR